MSASFTFCGNSLFSIELFFIFALLVIFLLFWLNRLCKTLVENLEDLFNTWEECCY